MIYCHFQAEGAGPLRIGKDEVIFALSEAV